MNIYTITHDYSPFIGGMASHAVELNKALAKKGHKCVVVTGAKSYFYNERFRFWKEYEENDGVKIIHLPGFLLFRKKQLEYCTKKISKRLNGFDTIIHLHELWANRYIYRFDKLPTIWTNHSSVFLMAYENESNHKKLYDIIKGYTWITAPSRELSEKVAKLGYPEERIRYIPNGVDIEKFTCRERDVEKIEALKIFGLQYDPGKVVVVCARRFVKKNGIHLYVNALNKIAEKEKYPNIMFLFAGNDCADDYGRSMTDALNSLKNKLDIHLLGNVPNANVNHLWKCADLCVLPSLMEATSITGLEAMASGIPIVGTNIGGIPELVVNNETGYLYIPDDKENLIDLIALLASNVELRGTMGQKARLRAVEKFSWTSISRCYEEVYRSAIDYMAK